MQKKRTKRLNHRSGAFTLIELLVVIAIIAVLMGVLMPALNRVREQARQQECGTRVRNHVLALNMYANENNGNMPNPQGSWLQDLANNVTNYMLRTGMKMNIFYCPSNSFQKKNMEYLWTVPSLSDPWDGTQFTTTTGHIISGYCYLTGSPNRGPINTYPDRDSLKPKWIKTVSEDHPSDRELVTDILMGLDDANRKGGYNFTEIVGDSVPYQDLGTPEQSSHLTGRGDPIGGNVGYLDGHNEWHKFNPYIQDGTTKYLPRTNSVAGSTPGYFW